MPEPLGSTTDLRHRVLLGVVPGVALVSLAGTVFDLPRADVIDALDSDRYRILWVMGSYLVGSAVGMTWTGCAAGLLGLRRTFLAAMILFTVAGGLGGFVGGVVWMTPLRLLQGLGAGLVLSPGMVLVWRAHPDHRDTAMAAYGLGVYAAAITGVVLGGLLTTFLSWRWLFWINLPLGGVLTVLAWHCLPPDDSLPPSPVHFDLPGFLWFVGWVIPLNVVLDYGQYWGWVNSPAFVPWLVLGTMSFLGFVLWGILHPAPLISLRPFAHRNFAVGLGIKSLFTFDVTVLLGLVTGYLINLRGYQWWQGSLVVVAGLVAFLGTLVGSVPWARHDNRRLRIGLGLTAMTVATWGLSSVDLYSSKYTTAAWFALWGGGVGLVVAPLLAVIFDGLTPAETVQGAGLFNIARALPAFVAGALLLTWWTQLTDAHADRLRQRITHNRPLVSETIQGAEFHFTDRGSPAGVSAARAHALVGRWVHANARVFALQDVLRGLALLTAVGLLLVPALRPTAPGTHG